MPFCAGTEKSLIGKLSSEVPPAWGTMSTVMLVIGMSEASETDNRPGLLAGLSAV